MARFIIKHLQTKRRPYLKAAVTEDVKNNIEQKEEVIMTTQEKINAAASILAAPSVKKIKKDKGLIERAESTKTILTEDNKELLAD